MAQEVAFHLTSALSSPMRLGLNLFAQLHSGHWGKSSCREQNKLRRGVL